MEFETPQYNERERAADRLATASLILGIISLFSTLCCCPFVFSAIGIVLALLSKGAEKVLRPRARTGLILSVVGLAVSVILIGFTIAFPIFMYKTNPQFRENLREEMTKSLDQDEELYRQIYGDDTFERLRKAFEEGDL